MSGLSKHLLVQDLNTFPELRGLLPLSLAIWHVLYEGMPEWRTRGQISEAITGNQLWAASTTGFEQALNRLRRFLAPTRWRVQARHPTRGFRRTSSAYRPGAYRLVRQ
jgi:hypothetical protein